MEMKINHNRIKQLRGQRLWSQEQTAIASGLSIRTIQRLEGKGECSAESLKAIAATFDCEVSALVAIESNPVNYYNVQLGYTIIGVLLVIFVLNVWLLHSDMLASQGFITASIIVAITVCLVPSLTTQVKDNILTWYFGIGFWRKSLKIADIKNIRQVKNKGWWGWGIRNFGQGWLYNVSGNRAVEIILNDGTHLRIGTDQPEELYQALNATLIR